MYPKNNWSNISTITSIIVIKKKNFWENYIWEVKQDEIKILIVTYGTMQGEWYLCL